MKKRVLIISLIVIICSIFAFGIKKTRADSGWDSSYDSSSSSSSDWGSSSSWSSSDWDSSSSSGSELSSGDVGIIIIIIIVIVFVALCNSNAPVSKELSLIKNRFKDVDDETLEKYGINREEFLDMAYDKYIRIQKSWMYFDYETLKDLVTDELYNTYYAQLEALKVKKQQNIMEDFDYVNSQIIDVKEENNTLTVSIYLNVKMYDYVINEKNKVLRGSKQRKIDIEYKISFVKPLKNKKLTNCPNCGGELTSKTREKCEHCDTIIVRNSDEFVMSKKTNIGQR